MWKNANSLVNEKQKNLMQHPFTRDVILNCSMSFWGHSDSDYADCRHSRCATRQFQFIPSRIEKSFKKCEIKYILQLHLCFALIWFIIENEKNDIVQWKKVFCGSNVNIDSNHMLCWWFFQQIAGYSAGIDYPNYSEVPQGGSFSCQNRIPGRINWNIIWYLNYSSCLFIGYYADMETRCQVWHWCLHSGQQFSFLCPNGTVFNQVKLVNDSSNDLLINYHVSLIRMCVFVTGFSMSIVDKLRANIRTMKSSTKMLMEIQSEWAKGCTGCIPSCDKCIYVNTSSSSDHYLVIIN